MAKTDSGPTFQFATSYTTSVGDALTRDLAQIM
jgi:hypothetical protein